MKGLLATVALLWCVECRQSCSKVMREPRPDFHMVAPCALSGMNLVARTNTTSVKRCSQFANLKQGLAFSFKSPEKKRTTPENCLIYDCPESDILQSIRREKNFNYYSLFADPLPPENAVCIVGVGMFRLHENKANYTDAMNTCRDEGGELASVLSSRRTTGLSNMVNDLRRSEGAYVGLNDVQQEGKFVTMSGKAAGCFEYKAWASGEPRSRRPEEDCVVVDSAGTWRVVDCSRRLPFICELLPKGPLPVRDEKGVDACELDLENRRLLRRTPWDKHFYKKSLTFYWLSHAFSM